jgi:hypothetical protein
MTAAPDPYAVTWADAVAAVRSMVDTAAELGQLLDHIERLAPSLPHVTTCFDPTPDDVREDAQVACEHVDSLLEDSRWLYGQLRGHAVGRMEAIRHRIIGLASMPRDLTEDEMDEWERLNDDLDDLRLDLEAAE